MIYLRTGLPGASKSLNSLRELVFSHDEGRPYFYTNIKLLMLDMDVARSFSGWFYGWYFPNLKDKSLKSKLVRIMKPIHDNDDFITLDDAPFLRNNFESHNHFDTWLYWVRRVYPKKSLSRLDNILACMTPEQLNSDDAWEAVKVCNLHFTKFDDPNFWYDLPKRSVVLVDECQQFFPPRPVGSRKPEAVARLETHRHGGYDLHFITQHPTLTDQNLRKLVNRHIHFFNPFGGKRIVRYESPKCVDYDNYHDKKQAKKKPTAHDVSFYGVYWSAEIHTHKFKFPKILLLGLFALFVVFAAFFYVVNFLDSKVHPDSLEPASPYQESSLGSVPDVRSVPDVPVASVDEQLSSYVSTIATDVYISGSMAISSLNGLDYEYSFYRSTDGAVFFPEDIGLEVQPINNCLANLIIENVIRPVTCNPFYVREVVDDEDEEEEEDFYSSGDSNDEDFQSQFVSN